MTGLDVVDRIARAIYPDFDDEPAWAAVRDARRRTARAVIAAFLAATRKPSEAMILAGDGLQTDECGNPCAMQSAAVWRAMHAVLARELGQK